MVDSPEGCAEVSAVGAVQFALPVEDDPTVAVEIGRAQERQVGPGVPQGGDIGDDRHEQLVGQFSDHQVGVVDWPRGIDDDEIVALAESFKDRPQILHRDLRCGNRAL